MTQERAITISPPGTGAARILVVDDDQTTCSFCALALSRAGYTVVPATLSHEALAALRDQGPFDLLLADIQMPGHNGFQLAELARAADPAIAVIIMTGHADEDILLRTARQGVADFLSKPFTVEELQFAVDQALRQRQLMQESVRLRSLERLLASSEAINATLDREALCRVILAEARGHVACAAGFLVIAADDGAPQVFAEPPDSRLLPAGLAAALEAAAAGRSRTVVEGPLCEAEGRGVGGGLAVPLPTHGGRAAALLLCDEGDAIARPVAAELLSLLANQAGTALHNAQLYGELQEAYQDVRELDRLKSEFIAIASHELRSPLSIVLGYTKMVRDHSDGDQREFAQRALSSAEQIKLIVDDMMRLRDTDLNRAELILEEVSLGELAAQAVERLSGDADAKSQQVALSQPEPALRLRADREKVLLVLGNLVSNAIKFTQPEGRISVAVERWPHEQIVAVTAAAAPNPTVRRLPEPPPPAWAVVRVADSGIGIPREQQSRIFERFYQVASSLTRGHGGAGLGLALVADLTRLQGGAVWVESEPGAGSTFSFALPVPPAV